MNKSTSESYALLFSTRKLVRELIPLLWETYYRENFRNLLINFFGADTINLKGIGYIFKSGSLGQEFEILKNRSDVTAVVGKVFAIDEWESTLVEIDLSHGRYFFGIDEF